MNPAQNLLIDADDTLWENHKYFLEVFAAFADEMERRGHDRARVLACVREHERLRTKSHGYGSRNFVRSLVAAQSELDSETDAHFEMELHQAGEWIFHHAIELFPLVLETLEDLRTRHRLWLVTKGNVEEQVGKVRRSGLAPFFESIEVLREKDPSSYEDLLRRLALERENTWMIGNSPRSDINPAARVGLRTVFIPHRTLWDLEREEFERPPEHSLTGFADLSLHF